jgi:hypothetical protein
MWGWTQGQMRCEDGNRGMINRARERRCGKRGLAGLWGHERGRARAALALQE